jgi:sugar phosphate isomerase/epimerase
MSTRDGLSDIERSVSLPVHPRISLHQVAFVRDGTPAFVEFCRKNSVPNMTLASSLIMGPNDVEIIKTSAAEGGPKASVVNHPFAVFPNLEEDTGQAGQKLLQAIDVAASIGAGAIYMQTGGRGKLDWEQAASRFTELLDPCREAARKRGLSLMIENASAFNVDIHIAHTLADTIALAEIAEIGVCIDLQPCWAEAGLARLFRRAMPITKLVQVSDYVIGDRVAPCRAVPGDGALPLEGLISDLLNAGYDGLFDLELVGPRIDQEGGAAASIRAVEWLSRRLRALGA